jgi:hypothetical protein
MIDWMHDTAGYYVCHWLVTTVTRPSEPLAAPVLEVCSMSMQLKLNCAV